MCNLYDLNATRDAMQRLFAFDVRVDDEPLLSRGAIYPDQDAPVVMLSDDGAPTLRTMRWGFPPPPQGKAPVTNARNLDSPFWRAWLKRPYRCLVPMTRFSENGPDKRPVWFARSDAAPLSAFAGVWRPWTGERLAAVPGKTRRARQHREDWALYAFVTTTPNALVAPIHPKAMPVVLTTPEACALWLQGEDSLARAVVEPAADDLLTIVA